MGDRRRKRTIRVSVPITLEVLARVETLTERRETPDKAALLADAIERGLAEIEEDARNTDRETAARRAIVESAGVPPEESGTAFQRGGHLAFGSRKEVEDRRGGARGLDAGRRESDRQTARAAFVERVMGLVAEGKAYADIAELLNAEGITTSRGQPWSGNAIGQVVRTERDKRRRQAWRPSFLK